MICETSEDIKKVMEVVMLYVMNVEVDSGNGILNVKKWWTEG